jgi:hypothetical protein
METGQGFTRPDAVDANARCECGSEDAGQGPKGGFAYRVGDEVRRRVPDPLVDDVDHVAFCAVGKLPEEALREQQGGAHVDRHVQLP